MKSIYLDTSAFLKPFLPSETGIESVEKILDLARNKKISIIISEWVVNESIATVQRKVRERKLSKNDASKVLTGIADLLEDTLQYNNVKSYAISHIVVLSSRAVIQQYQVNAADALHVVIAEAADCDYFVTADKQLVTALRKSKSKIKSIDINILRLRSKFFKNI